MLVVSLVLYLAIVFVGGHAQALSSSDAAAIASSNFLFSVDVLLDDSASPVLLGIRDGQTVTQVHSTEVLPVLSRKK